MITDAIARNLSAPQRELLLRHIDGPADVVRNDVNLDRILRALINAGLLRDAHNGQPSPRPRRTTLTNDGRMAVAMILGHYADELVNAGLMEQENPLHALKALAELKASGFPGPKLPPARGPLAPRPRTFPSKI